MVAVYNLENIDEQLNTSTSHYLSNEVYYNARLNRVEIPALFLWFRKDFGGAKGIREILKQYSVIPNDLDPQLKYRKYNWSLYLDNFY